MQSSSEVLFLLLGLSLAHVLTDETDVRRARPGIKSEGEVRVRERERARLRGRSFS
jgi:hypothetical protein